MKTLPAVRMLPPVPFPDVATYAPPWSDFQPKLYTDVLTQFGRGAKWRFGFKRGHANWRFDLCATPSSSAASSPSGNADKLASHIRTEIAKYADIVKQAHIKID
jgi:hypothetical protein